MNMNMQSVMKAAAIGAIINGILAVLGQGIGYALETATVSYVFLCCGAFLIPVVTGALYGYFAPGTETLQQSAMGGAVSGLVSGFVFGILSILLTVAIALLKSVDIGSSLTGATAGTGCCVPLLFGLIFGAVGGMVWTFVQKK